VGRRGGALLAAFGLAPVRGARRPPAPPAKPNGKQHRKWPSRRAGNGMREEEHSLNLGRSREWMRRNPPRGRQISVQRVWAKRRFLLHADGQSPSGGSEKAPGRGPPPCDTFRAPVPIVIAVPSPRLPAESVVDRRLAGPAGDVNRPESVFCGQGALFSGLGRIAAQRPSGARQRGGRRLGLKEVLVRRGKARFPSGCESRPTVIASVGSSRGGS